MLHCYIKNTSSGDKQRVLFASTGVNISFMQEVKLI